MYENSLQVIPTSELRAATLREPVVQLQRMLPNLASITPVRERPALDYDAKGSLSTHAGSIAWGAGDREMTGAGLRKTPPFAGQCIAT
eukprot:4926348-Amphidinium_carterae.1